MNTSTMLAVADLPERASGAQRRTIERVRERCEADPAVLGLIVIGSVARGEARADSDVDCAFVLDEEERSARNARGEIGMAGEATEETVRFEGQFTDLTQLRETARHGPEPARFAFSDAIVVFSHVPGLAPIVAEIAVYPEHERLEKMTSFVSQLPVHLAYLVHAERAKKEWLLAQTAVELVLFGGRLILAHNRILFPDRKQFFAALERAPEKPAEFISLARDLSARPSIATARRFYDTVMSFAEWPRPLEGYWGRFIRDRETNWRTGPPALADS